MTDEHSHSGSDGDRARQAHIVPREVTADPRNFSEYVLDPENADGKDYIFVEMLGYRHRSLEDAAQLSIAYVAQAQEQLAACAYRLGSNDKFGHRVTIEIALGNLVLLSGWILRPDSVLALATPFAGFAPRSRRT